MQAKVGLEDWSCGVDTLQSSTCKAYKSNRALINCSIEKRSKAIHIEALCILLVISFTKLASIS